MRQWYYADGQNQVGPIAEADFVQLFHSGRLSPQTMVWTEGYPNWVPAAQVPNLTPSHGIVAAGASQAHAVRPWVRYWARILDLTLFNVAINFVLSAMAGHYIVATPVGMFLSFLITALYIPAEALFLSYWGTTPGKALLRIRITPPSGQMLNYSDAIARSARVWVRGLALGVPFISLITCYLCYKTLTQEGITHWDRACGTSIQHEHIGGARIAAVVVLLVLPQMFLTLAFGQW